MCFCFAFYLGETRYLRRCSAPVFLHLKVGSPVICLRNTSGIVNGQLGYVVSLEDTYPTFDFDGKLLNLPKQSFNVYHHYTRQIIASRLQFPIKLAYAITVHRAQGQTLPYVIVDCSSFFKPGQTGVAIGRAVSKEGLQVVNFNTEAANLKHPSEVYQFYNRPTVPADIDPNKCCHQLEDKVQGKEPMDTLAHSDNDDLKEEDSLACSSAPEIQVDEELRVKRVPEKEQHDVPGPSNVHVSKEADKVASSEIQGSLGTEFPWDISTFIKDIESVSYSRELTDLETNPRLEDFVNQKYAWCVEQFKAVAEKSKEKDWQALYAALNRYLSSEEHLGQCKILFDTNELSKGQNKMGSKFTLQIITRLVDTKAQIIKKKQGTNLQRDEMERTPQYGDELRAKIRYIAGNCIVKIKQRLSLATSNKLCNNNVESIAQRRFLYNKQKMLSSLRITEAEINKTTEDPASLTEISDRQGSSRGLANVSDSVYKFFENLYSKIRPFFRKERMHIEGSQIHETTKVAVLGDTDLIEQWFKLFSDTDSEEDDLNTAMLLDLYDLVSSHFIKIYFKESLHHFKVSLPKKKKTGSQGEN